MGNFNCVSITNIPAFINEYNNRYKTSLAVHILENKKTYAINQIYSKAIAADVWSNLINFAAGVKLDKKIIIAIEPTKNEKEFIISLIFKSEYGSSIPSHASKSKDNEYQSSLIPSKPGEYHSSLLPNSNSIKAQSSVPLKSKGQPILGKDLSKKGSIVEKQRREEYGPLPVGNSSTLPLNHSQPYTIPSSISSDKLARSAPQLPSRSNEYASMPSSLFPSLGSFSLERRAPTPNLPSKTYSRTSASFSSSPAYSSEYSLMSSLNTNSNKSLLGSSTRTQSASQLFKKNF